MLTGGSSAIDALASFNVVASEPAGGRVKSVSSRNLRADLAA